MVFALGLLHPVLVPFYQLTVLALGMLLGQQSTTDIIRGMTCLLVGIVSGLCLTDRLADITNIEPVLLCLAMAIGLPVAIGKPFSLLWIGIYATTAGLMLGIDSAPDDLTGSARVASMLGTGAGLYGLTLYSMAASERLTQAPWQRIGIRIAGSWIAAISILGLAFIFRAA